jgi:hypothetical protein
MLSIRRSCIGLSLCYAAVTSCAGLAHAAPQIPGLISMVGAKGTCRQLTVGGRDASSLCDSTMINTSYRDDRVGFYFITKDAQALTFSGKGGQTHPNPDTAVQPLDTIFMTKNGKTSDIRATGVCIFTNPFKGRGLVSCKAQTASGVFSAAFETDGTPPKQIFP